MTYADRTSVRKLSGNPATSDVADSDIDRAISFSDARTEADTNHAGWLAGDQGYPLVCEASEYYASSWVRDRFSDPDKQADKHYQKAQDITDAVFRSSSLSITVLMQDYQTYPANPDASIYRSLPGSGSTENEPFI